MSAFTAKSFYTADEVIDVIVIMGKDSFAPFSSHKMTVESFTIYYTCN